MGLVAQTRFSHRGRLPKSAAGDPGSGFLQGAENLSAQPRSPHLAIGILKDGHGAHSGLAKKTLPQGSLGWEGPGARKGAAWGRAEVGVHREVGRDVGRWTWSSQGASESCQPLPALTHSHHAVAHLLAFASTVPSASQCPSHSASPTPF